MNSKAFDDWLPAYRQSADAVGAALMHLFQEAMSHASFNATGGLDIMKPREFLKGKRSEFPHRILFFTYSSTFDPAVESEILDSAQSREPFAGSLSPREILSPKTGLLEPTFMQLMHDAHIHAGLYTVALSANERLHRLPLVWTVPAEQESKTGFSPDYFWQLNFYFLCEISRAIVAYGGYSEGFFNEFVFMQRQPALRSKLLWLDQSGRLCFPDHPEETWPSSELANVLDRMD